MAKTPPTLPDLSRRERQIMDVLFRLGRATAAEVQVELPDPPSYSAVRSALSLLEQRGLVRHEEDGRACTPQARDDCENVAHDERCKTE